MSETREVSRHKYLSPSLFHKLLRALRKVSSLPVRVTPPQNHIGNHRKGAKGSPVGTPGDVEPLYGDSSDTDSSPDPSSPKARDPGADSPEGKSELWESSEDVGRV